MAIIQHNVGYTRMFFMVSSADRVSGMTGLTVAVQLSKSGSAFAAAGGAVVEVGFGWYRIALNTTDTNTLGDLAIRCTATGADPTDFADQVVAFNPLDAHLGMSRLDVAVSSRATVADVWAAGTRTLTGFGTLVADISSAVWSAATRTLTSLGAAVTSIWAEPVPGTYLAGSAAHTLANRAAAGDPMALTPTERLAAADALLTRNMALVAGEAARSPLNALRALRNRVSISGTTLTVTREDDTTAAWTAAVTTDAQAAPITGVDPA